MSAEAATEPKGNTLNDSSKVAQVKNWIKKNPKKSGALAIGTIAAVAIYKHVQQEKKDNALLDAAFWRRCEDVKRAVGEGADINAKDPNGETPLVRASSRLVSLLCQVECSTRAGEKVSDWLLRQIRNKREIIKYLVECGADVNARRYYYCITPLIFAVLGNDRELVECLVEHGADVNAKDAEGRTALRIAEEKHYDEIAEFLRNHGAV